MIISKQQELSSLQSVTVTGNSTNVIDLGSPGTVLGAPAALTRDIGPGEPIPLLCQVMAAFAGGTSLQVKVITSAAADLSNPTTVAETPAYTSTTLIAGFQIPIAVVPNQVNQRYMGLTYTCVGTWTAGGISAGITGGNQTNKAPGRA